MTERGGAPLVVFPTAANVNEGTLLARLVDAIPPLRQPHHRPGRPRRRPAKLHADKGYDSWELRAECRRRGIAPRIARRGIESSERLGRWRWKIERSISWTFGYRRLTMRYERKARYFAAFLSLAATLTCFKRLAKIAT